MAIDLLGIMDDELLQPLRGAIVGDDLIATEQLIKSIGLTDASEPGIIRVHLVAESYIIELRDGEQYKNPVTIDDIRNWLDAKGLSDTMDAYKVLATIQTEGTTWDRKGGSSKLQSVLNDENYKRVLAIAVSEEKNKILKTLWRSR